MTPKKVINDLKQYLSQHLAQDCLLSCFEQIDSTNDFLLKQARTTKPHICIALNQTKGRGQYHKNWQSDLGKHILLSVKYRFSSGVVLNGLSLVIGLSTINALRTIIGITDLKLKWPNDIYYQDKKLAGILIENQAQGRQNTGVIGLGINMALPDDFLGDQLAIDLACILGKLPDINQLYLSIINQILVDITLFERYGFTYFLPKWQAVDYLAGRNIILTNGQTYQADGINQVGALCLKNKQNHQVLYHSNQIKAIL